MKSHRRSVTIIACAMPLAIAYSCSGSGAGGLFPAEDATTAILDAAGDSSQTDGPPLEDAALADVHDSGIHETGAPDTGFTPSMGVRCGDVFCDIAGASPVCCVDGTDTNAPVYACASAVACALTSNGKCLRMRRQG